MKSYNARLGHSSDARFNEFPIVLKTGIPVHSRTKLSWIEEIDEEATLEEKMWYEHIITHNMEK